MNSAGQGGAPVARRGLPELEVVVEGVEAARNTVVPTLRFRLRIESAGGQSIRSIGLNTQIRIAAARRDYDEALQTPLVELFGTPERWGETLDDLVWTQTTVQVPPFTGATRVELPVRCTYDFEVSASKYLHALGDGEVPLEFLFSGTVFYAAPDGRPQIARIPRDRDADFRMPVAVWKQMMERHFSGTAWIRLERGVFDRLYAYKAERALPSWEAAVDALLDAADSEAEE